MNLSREMTVFLALLNFKWVILGNIWRLRYQFRLILHPEKLELNVTTGLVSLKYQTKRWNYLSFFRARFLNLGCS